MATSIAFDIIAKDRASDKFDKVGKSADRSSHSLRKFAKVGVLAVGAAAVVAGKALVGMAKNALEDQAAQRRLAVALHNTVGATDKQTAAVEKWISKQGIALGVTDDELRPAFQRLVQATGSITKAQKLAGVAMDASAGSGKSLKVVTEAISKAQNGNMGALSKLGIKIKDAKGETLSFDQAMKGMSNTFKGQAAAAANTAQGKFDRLKIMFDETKESIGAGLIPVAAKLADVMIKFAPTVSKAGDSLSKNLGPPLEAIGKFLSSKFIPALKDLAGKWLEGVRGMLDNVGKSMQDNKPFIDQVVKGLKALGEIVVSKLMPALGWLYSKAFPLLGTGIGVLITVIKKMTTAWLFMAEHGIRGLRLLLKAAFEVFGGILKAADKGLGWIPGIGGKIHDANKAFDSFKDNTLKNMDKAADSLHKVRDAINGVKSPKPVKVDVDTSTATFKLAGLQKKINGLHGKSINIYANILSSSKGPATTTDIFPHNARGTRSWQGGPTWVGETGPEIVDPPRGSRIYSASESQRMTAGGGGSLSTGTQQPIVVQLVLDGKVIQQSLLKLKRTASGGVLGLA